MSGWKKYTCPIQTHPHWAGQPKNAHLILFSYITMAQGQVLLDKLQCSEWILPYNIIMLLQGHLEMDGSRRFIQRLGAIVSDRTWHAATVWALQWLVYGKGAGEWMRPRVANKRSSCWTCVIHKNVSMSSKVGFLSEKNAKRVFEVELIDEVFEK